MSSSDGGLGWRDVAPETLWRLLDLSFGLGLSLPPHVWGDAVRDADFAPLSILTWLYASMLRERLQRHLSPAYRETQRLLDTVRGRPLLVTSSRTGDLERGRIRCQFEALTIDRPRNRQFKAVARLALRHCWTSDWLRNVGDDLRASIQQLSDIADARPSRRELSSEPIARHERLDAPLVEVAALLLQQISARQHDRLEPASVFDPDNALMRRVFERAIAALLQQKLTGEGWSVADQQTMHWTNERESCPWLPVMRPDIVLAHEVSRHTVIVETKFTSYWALRSFGEEVHARQTLKPSHLYQLYSYMRSQDWPNGVTGLLVYPYAGDGGPTELDFEVHGARMRMRTLDLRKAEDWEGTVAGLVAGITGCGNSAIEAST